MLIATHVAIEGPSDAEDWDSQRARAWSAPLGDVITRALAEDDDCDARLTQAWLVGLGHAPTRATYDRLFKRAVAACPGDPTARWLWGHHMVEESVRPLVMLHDGMTRNQALARPIDYFEAWVKEEPSSALAHAGLADALTIEAEAAGRLGVMPFTVRAQARRARDEYRTARSLDDRPEFAVGEARAMTVLSEAGAADALDSARPALGDTLAFREVEAAALESGHHFQEAADAASASVVDLDQRHVVFGDNWVQRPVWLGAQNTLVATVMDPTFSEYGAGGVEWLGFVPDYRNDDIVGPHREPGQREAARLRNLLLAGQGERVIAESDADSSFHTLALYLAGENVTLDPDAWGPRIGPEEAQNLYRYAGDLATAEKLAQGWLDETGDVAAQQRLGEICVLRQQWPAAIAALTDAVDTPEGVTSSGTGEEWTSDDHREATLQLAYALEKAGRNPDALERYEEVVALDPDDDGDGVTAAAYSRIAVLRTAAGDDDAALQALRSAAGVAMAYDNGHFVTSSRGIDILDAGGLPTSGAEYNNLAVALIDADEDLDTAIKMAKLALSRDPASPVYRDTLAQARDGAGQTAQAAEDYAAAIARDETTYQSQNNLGVIEARAGHRDSALAAFRAAVTAKPGYAVAWFNLGVALSHSVNPIDFLRSQAALAQAVRLDGSFRGAGQEYVTDRSAQVTGVDVSRPVPAGWTFGSAGHSPVSGLTWVLVFLALWRLALALGADKVGEVVATRVLSGRVTEPVAAVWASVNRVVPLSVGVIGCALIAAWPFLGNGSLWGTAATIAMMVALAWLFTVGSSRPRAGWAPGLVVGGAGALVGYAFVPTPVADTESRRRWTGAVIVGAVAGLGLVVSRLAGTPLLQVLGVAAFAMLCTALFPVRPFDGGYLRDRRIATVLSVVLLAVSSVMALGWV